MAKSLFKILFVDDEILVLNSLRRALKGARADWAVSFESVPEQAVELVRSDCPDVVVTDLNMPGLSGIEMVQAMRKTAPSDTVFIVLTGSGDLASAIEAINRAHVFRFLTKPCPAPELITAIDAGITEQVAKRGAKNEETARLANAALSQLSPSVVVVDPSCRVIYLNDSAGDLIAEKDGLFIDAGGICRTLETARSAKLMELVADADRGEPRDPQFLALPRPSEKRDLQVAVQSVDHGQIGLFLTDPERTTVPSPDSLKSLFGLTKAEAIVAHSLANGGTLDDAAFAGGITVSSARTYLKRVFLKTGVSRQSELVQLILSTPIPLVRSNPGKQVA